jgi:hypothetical protein
MEDKATTPQVTKVKKVRVTNVWNQIVPVYLSDGSERSIATRGFVDIEEGLVSALMRRQEQKGVLRIKPVK